MTQATPQYETVETRMVGEHVLLVTLNRPQSGNALNTQMEDVDSDLILNPVNTVAFFDAISSAGNRGGVEAIDWRHTDERAVFSFADGHCRPYKRAEQPSFAVAVAERN